MDEKARLGIRNWDFSEHAVGVPCATGSNEHQASFLRMNMMYPGRSYSTSEAEGSGIEFGSHVWVHQRNFLSAMKTNPNPLPSTQIDTETGLPAVPTAVMKPTNEPGTTQNGELGAKSSKIRKQSATKKSNEVGSKALKRKQPKKESDVSTKKKGVVMSNTTQKRSLDFVINGTSIDFSQVPVPVCSCTGAFRQCYRWGANGWQSSCCTTSISEYPLPMSSSRPGARVAGRKMSNGAYGKLLQRLAAEGYDFTNPVDLKDHWAKHGTNKFVTIK